eukprot:GEMP01006211.1.p1 GENE.GEMP01006211.1~~GEMP01006211.1.p1  ORF type:complete len:1016 (+),score=271.16 GEMP01006211.1:352-3399(+)
MDAVIQYFKDHTQVFGISRSLRIGDIEILEEVLRYAPDLAVLRTVVDVDLSPLAPIAPLPVKLNFGPFRALKIITLSNLRLGSLDDLILPQLERLVADGNDIAVLPRCPAAIWPLLVKADLSNNKIASFAEVKKLAELPRLRELDLRNNPLVVDADFAWVTGQLLPQLRYLNCMIIGTTNSPLPSDRPRDVLDRGGELSARIDAIAAGNGGWSTVHDIRALTHGTGIPQKSADHDRAFRLHRESYRTIRAHDIKFEQVKRAEDIEAAALDKYILVLTKFCQPPFSLRAVPLLSALVAYRSSGICEVDVETLEKKLLSEVKRKVPMRFTEMADVMDDLRAAADSVTRYEKKTAQLAARIQRLDAKLSRALSGSPPHSPVFAPQRTLLSDHSSMPPPSVGSTHLLDSPPLSMSLFPSPAVSSTCPPPPRLLPSKMWTQQRHSPEDDQIRQKKTPFPDRDAAPNVWTQQRRPPENDDFSWNQRPAQRSAIDFHVDAEQQPYGAQNSIPFSSTGTLGARPRDAAVVNLPSGAGESTHSVPNPANDAQHSTEEAKRDAAAKTRPSRLYPWAISGPLLPSEMDASEMRSSAASKPETSEMRSSAVSKPEMSSPSGDNSTSPRPARSPIKTRYARYKKTYGCHIATDCLASPTTESPRTATEAPHTSMEAPHISPDVRTGDAVSASAPDSAHVGVRTTLLQGGDNNTSYSISISPASEMAIEQAFLQPHSANVGARNAPGGIPLAVARASQELNNAQALERTWATHRMKRIQEGSVKNDVPPGQVMDLVVQQMAMNGGGDEIAPDSESPDPGRGWGATISPPASDTFTSDSGTPQPSPRVESRHHPPVGPESLFHADFNTSPTTPSARPVGSYLSPSRARPPSTSPLRCRQSATDSPRTMAPSCYSPMFARPAHFKGKDADVVHSALTSLRREGYVVPSSVNKLEGDATLRQTFLFLCHRVARSAAQNTQDSGAYAQDCGASRHGGRPVRQRNMERFDKWSVHGGTLSPVAKIDFTRFKSNR